MPTYDFKCPKCEKVKEISISYSARTPKCDDCGKEMKKMYSFAGAILKGSGWYSVDKRKTDGGTIGIEDPN